MSVNLEQAPGTGGKVTEPPLHPCKPKDASSATAVPTPSFSSSRRVKLCIGSKSLDAFYGAVVGRAGQVPVGRVAVHFSINLNSTSFLTAGAVFPSVCICRLHLLALP